MEIEDENKGKPISTVLLISSGAPWVVFQFHEVHEFLRPSKQRKLTRVAFP